MKNIKHSKYKNTGIIFEILTRQITTDVMSKSDGKSNALKIIRNFFKEGKVLNQELGYYNLLLTPDNFEHEVEANEFIDTVVENREKLDNSILAQEKYDIIKNIKKWYKLDEIFKTRINNYSLYAAVYKLFEYNLHEDINYNPRPVVKSRYNLIKHLVEGADNNKPKKTNIHSLWKEQEDDTVKILSYNILLKKFNKKYKNLNESQKNILKKYIYNVSNTTGLRKYLNEELDSLERKLKFQISKIKDKATKIKAQGIINELYKLKRGQVVKEKQLTATLQLHELLKQLKEIRTKEKRN